MHMISSISILSQDKRLSLVKKTKNSVKADKLPQSISFPYHSFIRCYSHRRVHGANTNNHRNLRLSNRFGKTRETDLICHASDDSSLFLYFIVVLVLGNFAKGTRCSRWRLPLSWNGIAWPRVRSEGSLTHEFIAGPLLFAYGAFLFLLHAEEVAHAMVM